MVNFYIKYNYEIYLMKNETGENKARKIKE